MLRHRPEPRLSSRPGTSTPVRGNTKRPTRPSGVGRRVPRRAIPVSQREDSSLRVECRCDMQHLAGRHQEWGVLFCQCLLSPFPMFVSLTLCPCRQHAVLVGFACAQSALVSITRLHRLSKPQQVRVIGNLKLACIVLGAVQGFYAPAKDWVGPHCRSSSYQRQY